MRITATTTSTLIVDIQREKSRYVAYNGTTSTFPRAERVMPIYTTITTELCDAVPKFRTMVTAWDALRWTTTPT